ncbi:hypothetical protein AAC387_Pa02g4883 [Persea americana]|eukprot:TRINITY_DN5088_c0_g1_i1.p1 TRINITY_DN5088_c0_g1~~TRINITY_DN5088_c0_g1_i1.p1  ORF type:complete len:180 (+),score=33.41 TRINITY_DN5088_c0_g1_i1:124-663(+)
MEINKLFIFFLLSLLFLQTPSCEADLIQDTCKEVSSKDPNINYNFCITALQSDPRSTTADLAGLGTISIQLTMAVVNKTGAHAQQLIKSGTFDSYDRQCLDVCLELYYDATSTLTDSLKALEEKSYDDANIWVSSVMDVSGTCEDSFKEREGHGSPLTEENDYLFQLSAIVLAIINKLA